MDDIGTLTIEARTHGGHIGCRITHADPTIRIPAVLLTYAADPDRLAPRLHLHGDHLTITDDYGRQLTYRIDWDNYSSGYYATRVDASHAAMATPTEVTA